MPQQRPRAGADAAVTARRLRRPVAAGTLVCLVVLTAVAGSRAPCRAQSAPTPRGGPAGPDASPQQAAEDDDLRADRTKAEWRARRAATEFYYTTLGELHGRGSAVTAWEPVPREPERWEDGRDAVILDPRGREAFLACLTACLAYDWLWRGSEDDARRAVDVVLSDESTAAALLPRAALPGSRRAHTALDAVRDYTFQYGADARYLAAWWAEKRAGRRLDWARAIVDRAVASGPDGMTQADREAAFLVTRHAALLDPPQPDRFLRWYQEVRGRPYETWARGLVDDAVERLADAAGGARATAQVVACIGPARLRRVADPGLPPAAAATLPGEVWNTVQQGALAEWWRQNREGFRTGCHCAGPEALQAARKVLAEGGRGEAAQEVHPGAPQEEPETEADEQAGPSEDETHQAARRAAAGFYYTTLDGLWRRRSADGREWSPREPERWEDGRDAVILDPRGREALLAHLTAYLAYDRLWRGAADDARRAIGVALKDEPVADVEIPMEASAGGGHRTMFGAVQDYTFQYGADRRGLAEWWADNRTVRRVDWARTVVDGAVAGSAEDMTEADRKTAFLVTRHLALTDPPDLHEFILWWQRVRERSYDDWGRSLMDDAMGRFPYEGPGKTEAGDQIAALVGPVWPPGASSLRPAPAPGEAEEPSEAAARTLAYGRLAVWWSGHREGFRMGRHCSARGAEAL
jgi:hypothetical protein